MGPIPVFPCAVGSAFPLGMLGGASSREFERDLYLLGTGILKLSLLHGLKEAIPVKFSLCLG